MLCSIMVMRKQERSKFEMRPYFVWASALGDKTFAYLFSLSNLIVSANYIYRKLRLPL